MCSDIFKYIINEVCSIINVSILLCIITSIGRAKSCDPNINSGAKPYIIYIMSENCIYYTIVYVFEKHVEV